MGKWGPGGSPGTSGRGPCGGYVSPHVCPDPWSTREWRGRKLRALGTRTSVRAGSPLVTGAPPGGDADSGRGCAVWARGCGDSLYFPANSAVNLRLFSKTGYKTKKRRYERKASGAIQWWAGEGGSWAGRALGLQPPTLGAVARPRAGRHATEAAPALLELPVRADVRAQAHFQPRAAAPSITAAQDAGRASSAGGARALCRAMLARSWQHRSSWAFWLQGIGMGGRGAHADGGRCEGRGVQESFWKTAPVPGGGSPWQRTQLHWPRSLSQMPGKSPVAPLAARPEPQACSVAGLLVRSLRTPTTPGFAAGPSPNSPATPLGLCTGRPHPARSPHTAACPQCLSPSVRRCLPSPPLAPRPAPSS